MTRYMVTYDYPSERPKTGCVVHDDKVQWRIVVGNPDVDRHRTEVGGHSVRMMQEQDPSRPLEDILETYLLNTGYQTGSEWEDSPYAYEETIERLGNELRNVLKGAALQRNARLMNIVRAGTETGMDLDPDHPQSHAILLDASGEGVRMAKPGLGYQVPDEERKRQIIAELLGMDAGGEEPTVVIVPTPEEVFSEREDLPGSEEGS